MHHIRTSKGRISATFIMIVILIFFYSCVFHRYMPIKCYHVVRLFVEHVFVWVHKVFLFVLGFYTFVRLACHSVYV